MTEGWECVEGCPVLELGRQSGVRKVGKGPRRNTAGAHNRTNSMGKSSGNWVSGSHDDEGTAARFFQTFPPETEDNLIQPVQEAESSASVQILRGDCVEVMREMPENSVDSVVCDPPYGLEFMGREWDKLWANHPKGQQGRINGKGGMDTWGKTPQYQGGRAAQAWHEAWAREALRILKPGGYLLAFGGTRTVHRLACAIEDAGFEIRDRYLNIGGDATESIPGEIAWVYGSGFPKSANIEKLMTKAQGQKRRAHGMVPLAGPQSAQMHAGIGSATKPAYEPIVCARKPLSEKNLVQNILAHGEWLEGGTIYKVGTGGLNIDASRVSSVGDTMRGNRVPNGSESGNIGGQSEPGEVYFTGSDKGRFPANLLLSHVPGGCVRVGSRRVRGDGAYPAKRNGIGYQGGNGTNDGVRRELADPDGLEEVAAFECAESCPVKALDEMSGERPSSGGRAFANGRSVYSAGDVNFENNREDIGYKDKGGASRFFQQFHEPGFFYSPKASKSERNRGLEGMPEKSQPKHNIDGRNADNSRNYFGAYSQNGGFNPDYKPAPAANNHPTVKPLSLMRYLVKLVTPENGTTLDPFAGSGTTGVAALSEGFNAILIEQDESYAEIAERRCAHALSEREEEFSGRLPL